jgi:hypothetical protein
MPKFLITFRLHYDDSRSYERRRQSLVDAISLLSPLTWDETTSVIFLECPGTSKSVREFLVANSQIYRDKRDEVVVAMITVHSYASIGMKNEALFNATTGTSPAPEVPAYGPNTLGPLFSAPSSASSLANLSELAKLILKGK